METVEENVGVDLNENEEGEIIVVGGKVGQTSLKDSLKAEKGHVYVTGNGRSVNIDVAVHHESGGVMLDRFLADSGVASGLHGGLNGFTESLGPVEGEGGGEGEELGLASCPAALLGRVSLEMGESEGMESPGSDVVTRGKEDPTDTVETSPLTGMHRRNCACTTTAEALSCPNVNMPNGGVDVDGPGADTAHYKYTERGFFSLDRDCEEVKQVNGGLHIVNTSTDTCEWTDSDFYCYSPNNNAGFHLQPSAREENQSNCSETLVSHCLEEGAPPATELPHTQAPSKDPLIKEDSQTLDLPTKDSPNKHSPTEEDPQTEDLSTKDPSTKEDSQTKDSSIKDPPTFLGSSAKLPNGDSPVSEPTIRRHDVEDSFNDLSSLPVRPQSLRTNPNLVVSLSCDATPLSPDDYDEDGGFYFEGYQEDLRSTLEAGRRQSAPDKLPDLTTQTDDSDTKLMPKRFGIADFFTRSLFTRKPKEPKPLSHNASGWRLFGKTTAPALDEATTADPDCTLSCQQSPQEEPDSSSPSSPCPQPPPAAPRRNHLEFEPLSTTALILEDRPPNLPAKSLEETQRHKMEYEEMVAGAKRREMKEAQRKKRQMKERHRQEDSISNAMMVWNTEILPHWDTMKGTRRVRELWWQGLPPSVRGRVWSLAIGNELNITPELYEIFLSRAKEKWRSYSETSSVNDSESDCGASLADRESSLDLIKLDISRTFPSLFIFQKGGPYHDLLHSVLGAYTCYRPDIGYVQGMSFIAAVLILNLEEAEAFITFANLLNKPCQMAFFRVDHQLMLKYFAAFEVFFEENLPRLFSHFQTNNLTPDLYLIDWIFTLYSKSLPLDVACRVWDVFCRDGEEGLFRTGLGILRLFQDVLLQMDFIHMAQFLSRLPDDLQPHTLFTALANTHMMSRGGRWGQVFSALMKDGNKETDKPHSPALRS